MPPTVFLAMGVFAAIVAGYLSLVGGFVLATFRSSRSLGLSWLGASLAGGLLGAGTLAFLKGLFAESPDRGGTGYWVAWFGAGAAALGVPVGCLVLLAILSRHRESIATAVRRYDDAVGSRFKQ